jgi:ribosomal protein S18 acetylase RimI-like enzyme
MNAKAVQIVRASVDQLELARQAVTQVHARTPCDALALKKLLDDPMCYLLLAMDENRVVGSLNGHALRHPHRADPAFLLYEIDVRPEFRNRGIGKALVNAFTEEARRAGASEIWVLTSAANEPAMAMYEACGYRRRNLDDVMLERRLTK